MPTTRVGVQVLSFVHSIFEIQQARMPLEISCPYCSKPMKLADSAAGLTIKCPRCNNRLRVGLDMEASTSSEPVFQVVEESSCPCCGGELALGAAVCMRCGYDMETRQRPILQRWNGDEIETIGSPVFGVYTEFVFRHDPFEGWVLFIDSRESTRSTGYVKLVLSEYVQAWINYFQVSADSGSMNLDMIDREGFCQRVYAGDAGAMEWLIDRFRKAGLEVKRV